MSWSPTFMNTLLVTWWVFMLALFTPGMLVPCNMRDLGGDRKVCVCNASYCDTIERVGPINEGEFVVLMSSKEGLRFDQTNGKFSQTKTKSHGNPIISRLTGNTVVEIVVNSAIKYQKMTGFGGAFSDAAGINILSLSKATQQNLLRSYFSEDGIEYNIGRVPIGGTDFSTHPYSYDDGAPDPNLNNFSLAKEDVEYKIPLIQQAVQMSGRPLDLLCASWSPPEWMKTNNAWYGFSSLKEEYYSTYAQYILRFLDEYKKHGILFWAVSTGNEPLDGIVPIYRFNSLGWTPSKMANWIVNDLGPQLRNSDHKNTLLLTYEDQRAYLPWWIEWMVDTNPDVLKYVDGFGVHWYLDFLFGVGVLDSLHEKYSDKFILYTEACEGYLPWQKKVDLGSWDRGESYLEHIIKNTNAWVTGWVDWNLALGLDGGPNWAKNMVDSPVIVNSSADEFYKQPMFYAMGHVSKFIEKNAIKVSTTPNEKSGIVATAVQNPDGRIVIVMVNKYCKSTAVSIQVDDKGWINLTMPAHSFATILC